MTPSHYERTGRLQRKIDVYRRAGPRRLVYLHSTNWHRTCREAVAAAARVTGTPVAELVGRFAR